MLIIMISKFPLALPNWEDRRFYDQSRRIGSAKMEAIPPEFNRIQYEPSIHSDSPPVPEQFYTIDIDDEVIIPDPSILNSFPLYVQFTKILYKIKGTTILDLNTQFEVGPGEILAIIGGSGSGKTTLLNILAGRNTRYEGDLTYNGNRVSNLVKRTIGYVTQDDILLKNLTVEESLLFTALLRLPKEPRKRVGEMLVELGINHCKKQKIGGTGDKNVISGGERKRTNVAIELLTNPSVLFLDEPTSGLDAKTALNLVDTMVSLANRQRTVVLTIHQPRSDIFARFNKLMILSRGKIVYFGQRDQVLSYFATMGCLCPSYFNPADFLIDQVSETPEKTTFLIEQYEKAEKTPLTPRISEIKSVEAYNAGYIFQTWILFERSFLSFIRDRSLFLPRLIQSVMMGILVGLVYLNGEQGQRTIQNLTGALFFIMIQQGMGPLFSTLNVFQSEKKVFFKEHESNQYSIVTYFTGKSAAELPAYTISPILFGVVCYFMVGLQLNAARFFVFLFILILIALCSHSLGLIISAMSPSLDIATLISPFIMTVLILFSGFYLNTQSTPVYFIWIPYVSFFRFGFEALFVNEFQGRTFTCLDTEYVSGICPITTGEQVIQRMGFQTNIWIDVGVLIGLMVAYRALALFCLWILTLLRRN